MQQTERKQGVNCAFAKRIIVSTIRIKFSGPSFLWPSNFCPSIVVAALSFSAYDFLYLDDT